VGAKGWGALDLCHSLPGASWAQVVGLVTVVFLSINALFGLGSWLVGGIRSSTTPRPRR
jgi:hypothetical protein